VNLLVAGVLLWSVVHLFPAIATGGRRALVARLGDGPYRGLFALLIVCSLVCIVLGWRSTTPVAVYTPAPAMRSVTLGLMVVALILFVSARAPTDIKRLIRHPQLTGVLTWAVAHLLSNGDSRSLVLFGGIGVWTIVEMFVINARDGRWRKPVVLLINEGTRSGKEVLAYGFRKYGYGKTIGTTSAGAVLAGRAFMMSNGGLLLLAVADVSVDGERLEGKGVTPLIEVPFDIRYAEGSDPQLARAIELLVKTVSD